MWLMWIARSFVQEDSTTTSNEDAHARTQSVPPDGRLSRRGAAQPSSFLFEMHRGVMRVWTDASRSVEVGKVPGNDYHFFSDMQRRDPIRASRPHHAFLPGEGRPGRQDPAQIDQRLT